VLTLAADSQLEAAQLEFEREYEMSPELAGWLGAYSFEPANLHIP